MKMRRKLGAICITLTAVMVSLLAVGSGVAAKDEKVTFGVTPGTVVVTNGIYTLSVEDTLFSNGVGTYTICTGAAHPFPNEDIFYGGTMNYTGTSYSTIRVYDTQTEYVSGQNYPTPSAGYSLEFLDNCGPVVSTSGTEVTVTWTTPENLVIEQVAVIEGTTLADSRVRVTTTVTNADSVAHSVGIRYMWDVMVDGFDGVYFAERVPDGPWLTVETGWVSPGFERYEITNDIANPLFNVFGTAAGPAVLGATPPDLLQYAAWGSNPYPGLVDYAFDYPYSGRTIAGPGYDNAVAYYWGDNDANKITLASGNSESVTALVFAAPPVNTPPSTNPVTITNEDTPSPTIGWAYFDIDGDPQAEYEVEVWTETGGAGVNMWDPAVGVGTDTSVLYGGSPLVSGETYYARVRASDGQDWGAWSEASWVYRPVTPPQVPGITGWGLIATAVIMVFLIPLCLKRRQHTSS